MPISWTYIKRGGTIDAPGYYETDDNGKVQTVKLAATINDWVHVRYLDNVFGSSADDLLSLVTPADKNFGVISLNGGDDTVELASADTYYLKLSGVEHVTGVAGATLKLAGPAAFETDGSVSLLANERNSAGQTITFSDLQEDISVNLGKGRDTVIFTDPVGFSLDGDGQLVAHQNGHALSFVGYADNATNLSIVVDDQTYTYRDLLASDLVDNTAPTIDTTVTLYASLGDPDYFFLYFSEAVSGFEFADLSVNNGHSLGTPIDANAPEPLDDPGGYMIRLSADNTVATGDVITLVGVTDLAGNALASTEITVTVV